MFPLHIAICQRAYFQQQVNYKIDVTLNDGENTLDGFEIIDYTNNSKDTLRFIWFHLWPNAYKNDRTALSEQLLQIGRTDFYFTDDDKRGYINRLDFKVNGVTSILEDHSQYIDVAKLILPTPLAPAQTIKISTPFHEKIPYNFSRGGHVGNTYQVTQWYPKPAVYDSKGWHPMPYLDQGEFYSEFGDFNVQITLPQNYIVAATGELQNEDERKWMEEKSIENAHKQIINPSRAPPGTKPVPQQKKKTPLKGKKAVAGEKKQKVSIKKVPAQKKKKQPAINNKPSIDNKVSVALEVTKEVKTLNYVQNNVHDFAWFADKGFIVKYDTLKLTSGKVIEAY